MTSYTDLLATTEEGNRNERFLRAALLAAVLAGFAAYHVVNVPRVPVHAMDTAFDWTIPLVPVFSVPYLLYLPFLFFTVAYGILVTSEWKRIGLAALLVQGIACATYVVYQTHVARPAVTGSDPFSSMLRFIYSIDKPYSTFPSLHVAHSLVCLAWWRRLFSPRWVLAAAALTAAILLSTLFLKQHVIADVIGGTTLAAAALAFTERLWPHKRA